MKESSPPHRILRGKLNIIDLAGNEDNRQSGNTGARMAESSSINLSLFALGNVINALNSNQVEQIWRNIDAVVESAIQGFKIDANSAGLSRWELSVCDGVLHRAQPKVCNVVLTSTTVDWTGSQSTH